MCFAVSHHVASLEDCASGFRRKGVLIHEHGLEDSGMVCLMELPART